MRKCRADPGDDICVRLHAPALQRAFLVGLSIRQSVHRFDIEGRHTAQFLEEAPCEHAQMRENGRVDHALLSVQREACSGLRSKT